MLEILVLIVLTRRIGQIVEPKGYTSGKYKWLTVGLWVGGEIIGAFLGTAFLGRSTSQSATCGLYIFALIGAVVGAWIAYSIANRLEPLPGYPKPLAFTTPTGSAQKLQELKQMVDSGLITA